ncbi:hypothetical protein BKI52_10275 [marine bacterium AO1-C]|nr:hypothetical protein BKI52_10275 [marine bacterium AO1-C]
MEDFPLHKLPNSSDQLIQVENIDYTNPYDYKKLHRHDYYEIILIEQGGGKQVIDFEESQLKSWSVYVVFPGQVHLLQREPASKGWVLQFTHLALPEKNLPLHELGAITEDKNAFQELRSIFRALQDSLQDARIYAHSITQHYLHILLWKVLQLQSSNTTDETPIAPTPGILKQFLSLLDQYLAQTRAVKQYADWLTITPKKLNELCKKHWGKTSLQVVHERLLLEIKRLLMTQNLSHKEVAYRLQFDSPAAFSAFVKKKTSLTPTELQYRLEQIYK